jgi:hypothetical protein
MKTRYATPEAVQRAINDALNGMGQAIPAGTALGAADAVAFYQASATYMLAMAVTVLAETLESVDGTQKIHQD